MTESATSRAVRRLSEPLRRADRVAAWSLAVGTGALVLAAGAWAARLDWFTVPWWVLLTWVLALTGVATVIWLTRRRRGRLLPFRVAEWLEASGVWRRGAVTALLEAPAQGTSEALLAAADRQQAEDVERRGRTVLEPVRMHLRRAAMAGGAVMLVGLAAFTGAEPTKGAVASLWHPVRAWRYTVAPVQLRASALLVDRGSPVELQLEAHGRREGTLWLRAPGEEWRPVPVRFDTAGLAVHHVPRMEADLYARLTSGSRGSDTVLVRVRTPAFLSGVSVTARYPRYLDREDEPLPVTGDTIRLPAGTRLEVKGEATTELRAARWLSGDGASEMEVSGDRFSGAFVPRLSGEYRLDVATVSGARVAGDTARMILRLVPDSAPVVDIPVPGADTVAPLSLILPLVVDARDDHGLGTVVLESRRISRLGVAEAPMREVIPLPGANPDRAILTVTLDLNRRGLLPGDTMRYLARAQDRAPAPGSGKSREFAIRLLTRSEMRTAERTATAEAGARLDSIVAASKRLERQTEDLARERPRSSGNGGNEENNLSFQEAKKAEAIAKQQDAMLQQAEQLERQLAELQRSAEAAGITDSSFQRRLDEVRDQLQRALTPEMRQKLAELQQALKDLDPERTQQSLEDLAEMQKRLREALERSRELFRRAAIEGDLANLAKESADLAREQREWNDQLMQADSSRAAQQEQALAERTDSLAAGLQQLAEDLAKDPGQTGENLESAATQAEQAGQQMREAQQAARQGQRQKARQKGEEAQAKLEPLSGNVDRAKQDLQEQWRADVERALDRALVETSRLTERQLAVAEQLRRGAPAATVRAEQGSIEEGAGRLIEQIANAGGKNALVSPQIGAALAYAQREMQSARDALTSATGSPREAAERAGSAVDALNAAAYQMLRSRDDVSGSSSGSGMAEAIQQMNQMAGKQGNINQQSAGLMPQMGAGGMQEQLRQLAIQQRALAQQLERLRAGGQLPGAGELAQESKDLARRMEAGRLDRETVERQERLFRRMLDAGRTLQGQEEDENKERQSTTATEDSVLLPPALRRRLEGEDGRARMPSWEELQRYTPEERRLVIDYFRQLGETSK